MNSPAEEFRIPLLDNFFRPALRKLGVRLSREDVKFVVNVVLLIACIIAIYIIADFRGDQKKLTTYKPEIKLDSLTVCSTNTSSGSDNNKNLMIWDLKLNISNPNNYSAVYTEFAVSIFSHNQTTLLTNTEKVGIYSRAKNHTSKIAYAEAFIEDPDSLVRTNGTIRFDLKFHAVFQFVYCTADDVYHRGDLVCSDAKVALSPSSSKSSCGSLVGDPLSCSYERYYKKSFWEYNLGILFS